MRLLQGLVLASLAISGCASGTPSGDPDGGGLFRCNSDMDCNDGAECTIDSKETGMSSIRCWLARLKLSRSINKASMRWAESLMRVA